jgi:hypothetical protein
MRTLSPRRALAALAVAMLAAAGLAAQALAAEPTLEPVPTVPVPAPPIPVPTIAAPPPAPAPAPAVPPPVTAVPAPVAAPVVPKAAPPAVAAPKVSVPSAPATPSAPSQSELEVVRPVFRGAVPVTPAAHPGATATAAPTDSRTTTRRKKQARPVRVTARSWSAGSKRVQDRVVVGVTFRLAQPQRVLLTLRGPAPSCRAVGTMSIRGEVGVNRLAFRGRLQRKSVPAGVYRLSLTRVSSGAKVIAPLVVQVVSPRRTLLLGMARAPRGECEAHVARAGDGRQAVAAAPSSGAFPDAPLGVPGRMSPSGAAAAPRASAAPKPHGRVPEPEQEDEVLGVQVGSSVLPTPGEAGPWAFAGALLLVQLLLVMLALVIRFVRSSWDPR